MAIPPGHDDELAKQHEDYSDEIGALLIQAQDKAYARGLENSAEEVTILRARLEICRTVMGEVLPFVPIGTREEIALRGAIEQATHLPS